MSGGHRQASAERGSILLVTLVLTGVITLLSITFGASVRNQLELARDGSSALHAELAAQSGLEYARLQLLADPEWDGTGLQGIDLGPTTQFVITKTSAESSSFLPTDVDLKVQGYRNGSEFRLESRVSVDPGDTVRNSALACLGGKLVLHHCTIEGSVTVTDKLGVIYDYIPDPMNPGSGSWVMGGPSALDKIQLVNTDVDGFLYKFTDSVYTSADERKTDDPVYMPAWQLEEFLVPGPGKQIFTGVTSLSDVILQETAVFHLLPGEELTLDDVTLYGGVVVYVEPTWDLRSGGRNLVQLKHQNVIGGGDGGVYPNIGLMAPGGQIGTKSGLGQTLTGLSFFNSADFHGSVHIEIDGQLVIVNDGVNMNNATFRYNPDVLSNPPGGIGFVGEMPTIDVASVSEQYDPYKPDKPFYD